MGEMLQAQQNQKQPTETPSAQEGRMEFYRDLALPALMGYAQVYTETGITRIWGKFKMSKECSKNRQELLAGMVYWSKTNGIDIDTSILFVKLAIEEMLNTKFNPWGPVAMYESVESGISPLMMIPKTTQEIEEDILREEAAD